MHRTLQRLLPRRLWENAAGLPALAALGAAGLAALTLWLDRAVGPGHVPDLLAWSAPNVRTILGALVGAIVSVAGFTFWMRAVMVQLVSSEFSPRVLSVYLEDAFQRTVTAFMVGALTYVILVLGAIPTEGGPLPVISVLLSIGAALGSVVAILVAIKNGVRSMEVSELVRRMTDRLIADIEARGARGDDLPPIDLDRDGVAVQATRRGWVQRMDRRRMVDALTDGATLRVDVTVGDFVDVGDVIGHVLDGAGDPDGIRAGLTVGRVRTSAEDLGFGFQQLVDVAEQALAMGSADATTAYEVMVHLGAALRALMRVGAPTGHVRLDGRCVVNHREPTEADHVRDVLRRLRLDSSPYPAVVAHLLEVIEGVRRAAIDNGRDDAARELEVQAARLLDGAAASGILDDDLRDLRGLAAARALVRS